MDVSIRPRRWGRGKPGTRACGRDFGCVSIRPRRWGRGKPAGGARCAVTSKFQSAPGGGAGGNPMRCRPNSRLAEGFNPPPAVGPGETSQTRPRPPLVSSFQSAPGGGAGGNPRCTIFPVTTNEFQSAPGGGAGGNEGAEAAVEAEGEFQSAPGGGAGGNDVPPVSLIGLVVSIRPRRWGRGKPFVFASHHECPHVSIRPRRWGRGKPGRRGP